MKTKKLLMFVLLLIMMAIFIACSGDKDATGNAGENKVTEDSEVKLVMYSWRPEDREMYEKAIKEFQKYNPNIIIDFQPYKSTEYNTILTNALISGKGPDIIQLRPYSGAKTIADNDYLISLDDLNGIENFDDQYLDAARGSNGKVYGVPLALNSGVIFYNTRIFEEFNIDIPETWDDLLEVSEILLENDIVPIAQSGRAAYLLSMTHAVLAPSLYQGNDFIDEIIQGKGKLSDQRFVDSVQGMKDIEAFFPKDFIALEDEDAQTMLYMEQAAMYINGEHRLGTFESTAPDLPIGVIPGLASKKGEDPFVTTWVDGSFGAVKKSEHPEETLKFMEFLASKDFGQIFSNEVNRLSAISGIEPEHPLVKQIAQAGSKNSTPYLMLVHFGEGETTTKTIFENALQGLYLNELTVEEVIKESEENVNRIIKNAE